MTIKALATQQILHTLCYRCDIDAKGWGRGEVDVCVQNLAEWAVSYRGKEGWECIMISLFLLYT